MMGRRIIQFLLLPLFQGFFLYSAAQSLEGMQAQCLQIQKPQSNTTLFISLDQNVPSVNQTGGLQTDLDLIIEFREPKSQRVMMSKSLHEQQTFDFFSSQDPLFREFHFDLPPGQYRVVIDVNDRNTGKSYLTQLNYECLAPQSDTWISDIVLLEERDGAVAPQPLVGGSIGGITDKIRFQSYVYGAKDEILTARAILYLQQQPPPGKDDREYMQISQYTAALQVNEVLELSNGEAEFSGGIDLAELAQGSYLLELFLYREDSVIAEKNTAFIIPWKRLKEVFLDLNYSISQMAYIAPQKVLTDLQSIQDQSLQLARFMAFWEERADPNLESAADPLERYFSRIFYADSYFSEHDLNGWKTDRGHAFTLYGSPDNQFNREWRGNIYEVWSYEDMDLDLVFVESSGHWHQVYPVTKN